MPFQTSTNEYQNTKYIVDAIAGASPYATIQSAITAAAAIGVPATIFIRAGTYTENLVLSAGIELQGSNAFQTIIVGVHTPPAAGRCALLNIGLQSATHILSSAVAGTATIKFSQCTFNITNGYVCNMTNWTGTILFEFCSDNSTINGVVINTATAAVIMNNNTIGKGTANPMTIDGVLTVFNTAFGCPINLSGAAVSVIDGGASFLHTVMVSGNANVSIANSRFSTGADTSLVTTSTVHVLLSDVNMESSNANVIDGTGSVQTSLVSFSDSMNVPVTITHVLAGLTAMGVGYMTDAVIENLSTPGMLTNDASGDVGSSATTEHAVQIGDSGGQIKDLAVGATGETLMGATGADCGWTNSPSFGGSVTAGTTLTATLGNITATAGDLVIGNVAVGTTSPITYFKKSRAGAAITSGDLIGT
jgi:hypothetical protein